MDKTLLITGLQRIEVRPEFVQCLSDVAGPIRVLPLDAGGAECRENPLVGIHETFQMDSVVAYISKVDERVLGQLPLHAEEKVLDIAVAPILGNPRNVVGGRVECGHQAAGKSLIRGGVAAGSRGPDRDDLGGSGVLHTFVAVGVIWVTAANCACGALMPVMSPEPARV